MSGTECAVAHWHAVADPAPHHAYVWVIVRHEIDYLRALKVGETAFARTWVADPPKGARFDRRVRFTDVGGKELVAARTTWAMIERASGRPMRVPAELAARFRAG